MTDKSLKNKAIKIQGKSYVLVSDRINYFNETYPGGSIVTRLVGFKDNTYIVKAIICPDVTKADRIFTGYSQAKIGQGMVNQSAALENCETSAVGRALAMMGIGVIDSIASVDEINKATSDSIPDPLNPPSTTGHTCPKCGAPMKMSIKGTEYCSALCWKQKTRLPFNK